MSEEIKDTATLSDLKKLQEYLVRKITALESRSTQNELENKNLKQIIENLSLRLSILDKELEETIKPEEEFNPLKLPITSDQTDKVNEALALAQAIIKPIFAEKTNDRYKKNPNLASLVSAAKEALGKNSLAVSQVLWGNWVLTELRHKSGQYIRSVYDLNNLLPNRNQPNLTHDIAGRYTSICKYVYAKLLGIPTMDEGDESRQDES